MRALWLVGVAVIWLLAVPTSAASGPSRWEQPAAQLADQISGLLGPGQARITIRNLSTIPTDELPAIRHLLEQDLKAHGIVNGGAESANAIRVTLSENQREMLWVAEVSEGAETRVAIATTNLPHEQAAAAHSFLTLHKEPLAALFNSQQGMIPDDPVLSVLERGGGYVVLHPGGIAYLALVNGSWQERGKVSVERKEARSRDPRGILIPTADSGFTAFLPSEECTGTYSSSGASSAEASDLSTHCHPSDDPWPIAGSGANTLSAFLNPARNYFTGVVSPSLNVDLPPFYSAAVLPRPAGNGALLIAGIDGKIQLAENGLLKPVSGTRDWGSDIAVFHYDSTCGAGSLVIASASGEAATDSLGAYEIPALEAVPASAPLAMEGTVTSLMAAPDGKSIFAVVRNAKDEYEVDRVTATCN